VALVFDGEDFSAVALTLLEVGVEELYRLQSEGSLTERFRLKSVL
jgi:hypothetical protein